MRYISEIWTSQREPAVTDGLILFNRDFSVTVHDSESGADELIAGVLLQESDAWGYADIAVYGNPVVVRHTEKTALLHKYIDSIETEAGTGQVYLAGIDFGTWCSDKVIPIRGENNPVLAIDTKDDSICTSGVMGSVVSKQTGFLGGIKVMTLYDILIETCRALQADVMAYEVLIYHSPQSHYTTTIRFSQSQEAKRFLLKMWLEATMK